jgi:molybdenum cofactor cytidylyltransferase
VSRIVGIVLAAGMSRRLGRPKQLLVLDGTPLIAHVLDRALASTLDAVILVTGAHCADVRAAVEDRNVLFAHNPEFEEGQGTSLAAGVAALDADVDAAVVMLGDQPGISPEVIDRVINERRTSGAPVVMARYGHQRGHPVLFGHELFPELRSLAADTGGREIVRDHQDSLVLVVGGADAPPPDVDTEEAWAELQYQWPSLRGSAPPVR